MGNLMDQRFNGLHLAHAFINGDALINQVVVAMCATFDFLKSNRNGRNLFQGAPKGFVLLHIAGELINHNVGKLLAIGLRDIEDTDHLECRTQNLYRLCDGLSVCV